VAKTLDERQQKFLEALFGEAEGNYSKALRIAGYAPTTTKKDIVSTLRDEIVEYATNELALNTPKAISGILNVLGDGLKPGASNILKAAKEVLDRANIKPKESSDSNTGKTQNIFIMPAKNSTVSISTQDDGEE
jgi:hypothetical protein